MAAKQPSLSALLPLHQLHLSAAVEGLWTGWAPKSEEEHSGQYCPTTRGFAASALGMHLQHPGRHECGLLSAQDDLASASFSSGTPPWLPHPHHTVISPWPVLQLAALLVPPPPRWARDPLARSADGQTEFAAASPLQQHEARPYQKTHGRSYSCLSYAQVMAQIPSSLLFCCQLLVVSARPQRWQHPHRHEAAAAAALSRAVPLLQQLVMLLLCLLLAPPWHSVPDCCLQPLQPVHLLLLLGRRANAALLPTGPRW